LQLFEYSENCLASGLSFPAVLVAGKRFPKRFLQVMAVVLAVV
jgi:hypothetical protein